MTNVIYPIIVGLVTPVFLFMLGYLFMKSNRVTKLIYKVYNSVRNGLEIYNDDEVVSSPLGTNVVENSEIRSIDRTSKDYGPEGDWKIRTFYTVSKNQILENEIINFLVRGHEDINIQMNTRWLVEKFDLKSETESISDGVGKIRIYLFQEKMGNEDFYLVRFGTKALEKPIKLTQ